MILKARREPESRSGLGVVASTNSSRPFRGGMATVGGIVLAAADVYAVGTAESLLSSAPNPLEWIITRSRCIWDDRRFQW